MLLCAFTNSKVACVASVSLRFRSKERGTRVKDRAKNDSRFISRAAKTGLSLLRNQIKLAGPDSVFPAVCHATFHRASITCCDTVDFSQGHVTKNQPMAVPV